MAKLSGGDFEADQYSLNITLTRDEFDTLILMAGFATGAAFKQGARKLAYSFLQLANEINRNNPNWRPYEIPEDMRSDRGVETAQNPNPESDRP